MVSPATGKGLKLNLHCRHIICNTYKHLHVLYQTGEVELMPVPSSYQDLSQDRDRMNHIGWVWYDRDFWMPNDWNVESKRISLRFGSVNYYAIVVWCNFVPHFNSVSTA